MSVGARLCAGEGGSVFDAELQNMKTCNNCKAMGHLVATCPSRLGKVSVLGFVTPLTSVHVAKLSKQLEEKGVNLSSLTLSVGPHTTRVRSNHRLFILPSLSMSEAAAEPFLGHVFRQLASLSHDVVAARHTTREAMGFGCLECGGDHALSGCALLRKDLTHDQIAPLYAKPLKHQQRKG